MIASSGRAHKLRQAPLGSIVLFVVYSAKCQPEPVSATAAVTPFNNAYDVPFVPTFRSVCLLVFLSTCLSACLPVQLVVPFAVRPTPLQASSTDGLEPKLVNKMCSFSCRVIRASCSMSCSILSRASKFPLGFCSLIIVAYFFAQR